MYHLAKRRFLFGDERFKEAEAVERCEKNVISINEALDKIANDSILCIGFQSSFKEEIREANDKIDSAKVRLGGPGSMDLLYNLVRLFKSESIIETGVAYGWSSMAILAAIYKNKRGRLISVDMPYPKLNSEQYVGIVVPDKWKSNWKLIRKPDRNGLLEALQAFPEGIDLCHYDSDKSYDGRLWAYEKLWKALKEKGIFISDDIQDNIAFFKFAEAKNKEPLVIKSSEKYVGILVK
jgi:predicted O-methyltransferase YrrM